MAIVLTSNTKLNAAASSSGRSIDKSAAKGEERKGIEPKGKESKGKEPRQ